MLIQHGHVLFAILRIASAAALPYNEGADNVYHGWSTITAAIDTGNCMLGGKPAGGFTGLAISGNLWNGGSHCGDCVTVKLTDDAKKNAPKSTSGCVTGMIMDKCPECETAHLDLWPGARGALGYPANTDNPDVTWEFTPCSHNICGGGGKSKGGSTASAASFGPLKIHTKDSGVSQWWFQAQVLGAVGSTKGMSAKTTSGWKKMKKEDYNYFTLESGTGSTSPTSIRVTGTDAGGKDKVVQVDNVPIENDKTVTAKGNYQ